MDSSYPITGVTVGRLRSRSAMSSSSSSSSSAVVGVELFVGSYGSQLFLNITVEFWVNVSNRARVSVGVTRRAGNVTMNVLASSGIGYTRYVALVLYAPPLRTLVVFSGDTGGLGGDHALEYYCCIDSSYSDPLVLEFPAKEGKAVVQSRSLSASRSQESTTLNLHSRSRSRNRSQRTSSISLRITETYRTVNLSTRSHSITETYHTVNLSTRSHSSHSERVTWTPSRSRNRSLSRSANISRSRNLSPSMSRTKGSSTTLSRLVFVTTGTNTIASDRIPLKVAALVDRNATSPREQTIDQLFVFFIVAGVLVFVVILVGLVVFFGVEKSVVVINPVASWTCPVCHANNVATVPICAVCSTAWHTAMTQPPLSCNNPLRPPVEDAGSPSIAVIGS